MSLKTRSGRAASLRLMLAHSPPGGEFPQSDGYIAMTDPQAVPDIRRYQAHAELFDKLSKLRAF